MGKQKQRQYFANKGPSTQGYGFSSGHVWMWELDCEECWVWRNWCFWTVVLGKTLESFGLSKEIQPVHPKGDQSWVFIERTDAEAETPILWPPVVKNWLTGKDSDAGKDWKQKKGMTEDEMVGWHLWPNGHEFEQVLGDGEGQGSLVCCSPWGCKESDLTERLNDNHKIKNMILFSNIFHCPAFKSYIWWLYCLEYELFCPSSTVLSSLKMEVSFTNNY